MNNIKVRDILKDVYDLIQIRKKLMPTKEYAGKEIDSAYFNGMDDILKEVFGRLHMYNLLDVSRNKEEADGRNNQENERHYMEDPKKEGL